MYIYIYVYTIYTLTSVYTLSFYNFCLANYFFAFMESRRKGGGLYGRVLYSDDCVRGVCPHAPSPCGVRVNTILLSLVWHRLGFAYLLLFSILFYLEVYALGMRRRWRNRISIPSADLGLLALELLCFFCCIFSPWGACANEKRVRLSTSCANLSGNFILL